MSARPPTPEVSQMTPYLWALMAMLVSATVFDAFNIAILSTVAPMIQQLHGLNNTQWGLVNLIIRVGAVISFFVLMLADRFGRRAVITLTILGYAVFTGLTGLWHAASRRSRCGSFAPASSWRRSSRWR